MSVSSSMSNALTGLSAAARAADVVSSNVANALTEGYGRRTLELSARSLGGAGSGVQVNAVLRQVNQAVLSDRRSADATLAGNSARASFLSRIESTIGTPDQPGSLNGRIAAIGAALITAASRPDSEARLSGVLSAASGLVTQINAVSDDLQVSRMAADKQIGTDVATVNDALGRIQQLNRDIWVQTNNGNNASPLMDQRQQQIDRVASILPVREVPREHNQVALFTTGGLVLLEGKAATLEFTSVGVITPDMTQASGALSGLTVNGRPVATAGSYSPISGGSLAAGFEIRDELAAGIQTQLDAVARDLVERFSANSADPTLVPGTSGLFTDAGAAFDPLNEIGLSGRLRINALADPDQGGALWRLRDGLGAAAPGAVGNATGLLALSAALETTRIPASGAFNGTPRSASTLAADFLSMVGEDRQTAEASETYAASRQSTLKALELQGGVDTDQEMQQLLLVEQAYTANARVVQTLDEMIKTLLSI